MAASDGPKQRYQGVQKESAGYRLMTAMGWKEGEGLGASKQGIKEHIRVKKNFENWGVGVLTAADRAKSWNTGMAEFHRVLSTLSEITSQHAGKGGDSDDDGSDGGASDASDGGAAAAAEAKKRAKKEAKKAKKKEKKEKKKKKRSSSSSESDEEEEKESGGDEDAPAPKRVKLATHLGRFKKRENAKMVKNYSSHDLAAILGDDPFAAAAAAVTAAETAPQAAPSSGGYESDSESEDDAEAPSQGADASADAAAASAAAAEKENSEEGAKEYWWSSYFVRCGRMGSLKRSSVRRGRGFSEQDQTDLYNAAQDGATQGRVGLGRSSMPKKVAGARWEGKKIKLGSDSEDEGPEEGEEGSEEEELGAVERMEGGGDGDKAKGVVIVLPGGKQVVPGADDGGSGGEKKPKWKKAAIEVLKEAGKDGMKMKALQKAVMERLGLEKSRKEEAAAGVAAAVEGSSKFKVQGKMVVLT